VGVAGPAAGGARAAGADRAGSAGRPDAGPDAGAGDAGAGRGRAPTRPGEGVAVAEDAAKRWRGTREGRARPDRAAGHGREGAPAPHEGDRPARRQQGAPEPETGPPGRERWSSANGTPHGRPGEASPRREQRRPRCQTETTTEGPQGGEPMRRSPGTGEAGRPARERRREGMRQGPRGDAGVILADAGARGVEAGTRRGPDRGGSHKRNREVEGEQVHDGPAVVSRVGPVSVRKLRTFPLRIFHWI